MILDLHTTLHGGTFVIHARTHVMRHVETMIRNRKSLRTGLPRIRSTISPTLLSIQRMRLLRALGQREVEDGDARRRCWINRLNSACGLRPAACKLRISLQMHFLRMQRDALCACVQGFSITEDYFLPHARTLTRPARSHRVYRGTCSFGSAACRFSFCR